jgi:hypothetical protein
LRETKIAVGNPFERLHAQHYRTVLLSVSDVPPVADQPLILVCAEVALVPAAKALRLAQFYDSWATDDEIELSEWHRQMVARERQATQM